jgi:hypothetical protein
MFCYVLLCYVNNFIIADGEPVDVHVVHFIHMALFLVALLYIFSNISIIVLMKRTADRWASYEAFCLEVCGVYLYYSSTLSLLLIVYSLLLLLVYSFTLIYFYFFTKHI